MRLPQDSVDVVVGDTSPIAMETMLQGAGRILRLGAEGVLVDAVVLTMYAWPHASHSLWGADPITAVAAGRLQIQNRYKVLITNLPMGEESVNKPSELYLTVVQWICTVESYVILCIIQVNGISL